MDSQQGCSAHTVKRQRMYDQKAEAAIPIKSHHPYLWFRSNQCLDPGPLIEERLYPQEAEPTTILHKCMWSWVSPVLYQRDLLVQPRLTLKVAQEFSQ